MSRGSEDEKDKWGIKLKEDWKEVGVILIPGSTSSKIVAGWHPSWKEARGRKRQNAKGDTKI